MATPSIFSSQTKATSPLMKRSMRLPHASSSSKLKALSSDIMGVRWRTGANWTEGAAPAGALVPARGGRPAPNAGGLGLLFQRRAHLIPGGVQGGQHLLGRGPLLTHGQAVALDHNQVHEPDLGHVSPLLDGWGRWGDGLGRLRDPRVVNRRAPL